MKTKTCCKCKEEKPIKEFSPLRRKGDKPKLQSWCKLCMRLYRKRYYKKNKEAVKEWQRNYEREMKKFNNKTAKKRLDIICSEVIRKRDKRCLVCGRSDHLQAHHAIKRKHGGGVTRWVLKNLVTLCYGCHIGKLHGSSDSDFLEEYLAKLDKKIPEVNRLRIRRMANRKYNFNREVYEKTRLFLLKRLRRIEDENN